jgi:hypothetical protein
VPPSLISGEVVAKEIAKDLKISAHESLVWSRFHTHQPNGYPRL